MNALGSPPLHFPAIWLRANCPCTGCRDAATGQSLFDITDLPFDLQVAQITQTSTSLEVVFAPDGHRSVFDRAWLEALALARPLTSDFRCEQAKTFWCAVDLVERLPTARWDTYLADDSTRLRCLESVLRLGFVILHDLPRDSGSVLHVAETFGYVRETNYGRLFDVRAVPNPNNLANTGLPLSPHTDNPYRDPVPTLQLLHCLIDASEGGDSTLVDGFRAASLLRSKSPEDFTTLASTPITFTFRDADTELSAFRPMIEVNQVGNIREVRFSNRHMRPVQLPAPEVIRFFEAYRRFAELLYDPAAQISFKLRPGDCMIFDNTRILHARTAFNAAGERHLQGCYADLDSLASSVAVLRRNSGRGPASESAT